MGKRSEIRREISSLRLILNYKEHLTNIASNCFVFENLPDEIDIDVVNKWLVKRGSVVFFKDIDLDKYFMMPYTVTNKIDVYGNPIQIQAYADNGTKWTLEKGNYVIMYDYTSRKCNYNYIIDIAERLALCDRVIDANIFQQKNPRIFNIPDNKVNTIKQVINDIDTFKENIVTYEGMDLKEIQSILEPVPFISDKVEEERSKIFSNFLQTFGLTAVTIEKKERLIENEILHSQNGAFVSRESRLKSRKRAVEQINKMFGLNIEVNYFQDNVLEGGVDYVRVDDEQIPTT